MSDILSYVCTIHPFTQIGYLDYGSSGLMEETISIYR